VTDLLIGIPESGTFSTPAEGTQCTTSVPHLITDNMTAVLSSSPYDGTQTCLGTTSLTFNISAPFTGGGTGSVRRFSLTQDDINVITSNNGALPDSIQLGAISLGSIQPVVITTPDEFVPIAGSSWSDPEGVSKEISSSADGVMTILALRPRPYKIHGFTTGVRDSGGVANFSTRIEIDEGGGFIGKATSAPVVSIQAGRPNVSPNYLVITLKAGDQIRLAATMTDATGTINCLPSNLTVET